LRTQLNIKNSEEASLEMKFKPNDDLGFDKTLFKSILNEKSKA
jgi:hypothetical protein